MRYDDQCHNPTCRSDLKAGQTVYEVGSMRFCPSCVRKTQMPWEPLEVPAQRASSQQEASCRT